MSVEYRVGDVRDRLAEIGDGSIDLIVTSPPFLALRSYLPADHPDKQKEIGSEATPAAFIDTLLALTAEFGRVLAPHGSLCVELGDTFSGSGGAGGDYNTNGLRAGQPRFRQGYDRRDGRVTMQQEDYEAPLAVRPSGGSGWPLAKSLTGIPTLYPWSLAYGRNLLTGEPSPAGLWRIRNVIVWARPNPPVGALGDKFRPATSYITVACRGPRRFFDLDAVRTEPATGDHHLKYPQSEYPTEMWGRGDFRSGINPAGAPPLDWHTDLEDGDWLWKLPTQPYAGAHYATFPLELPTRLIMAMCPLRVCTTCGKPSERITEKSEHYASQGRGWADESDGRGKAASRDRNNHSGQPPGDHIQSADYVTVGWSDCGHNAWRTGNVLDPFAGSGTTLEAAQNVGRHTIGIDLDTRNASLAQQRVGMFMAVDG